MKLTDNENAIDLHVEATSRLVEALVESESRMQRRIKLLSEVVFEVDLAGSIVYLNDAWWRLSGQTAAASVGKSIFDYFLDVDAAVLRREMGSADAQVGIRRARLIGKEGNMAWVSIAMSPLPGGGFVGVLHDITEEKRTQDEVAKLSVVASATDNLVIITDAAGVTEWVNDAFVNRTGFTLADVVGKKPGAILQGPGTDKRAIHRLRGAIAEHRSIQEEILNYTRDGEPYWVNIQITPIHDADGEVIRYISVQSDTTDRKGFENQLLEKNAELEQGRIQMRKALEEAEAANKAKSVFLANMSHELRTPLNGILGMTQSLSREDFEPKHKEQLDVIRASGEALLAILNDVLDLSKIEAGKMDIENIEFDLAKLVDAVQAQFSHLAAAKELDFSVEIRGVKGAYLGDPTRIRQILSNLISNALKFTESGGLALSIQRREGGLIFTVADTGVGMSHRELDKLFLKFSQADPSTTRRYGGTGLGLSICRQLVEMMGGHIAVKSRVGVGSTFTVDLPLIWVEPSRRGAMETEDPGVDHAIPIGHWRVLAAEDNNINRRVLRTLLNRVGIEPAFVQNGREAVEACRTGHFDLILMDIQMPEMDGMEAARAIRRLESGQECMRTPIIAVTANVMPQQVELYNAAGMDGLIAKPIHIRDLSACLTKFLSGAKSNRSSDWQARIGGVEHVIGPPCRLDAVQPIQSVALVSVRTAASQAACVTYQQGRHLSQRGP